MTNLAEAYDDATPSGFLIVGLGASAGGVEALRDFFAAVPADSGIAYVVILHLSPEHESQLATILQTVTPLPVTQVTKRVRVVPNHVYVVPPNQHLTMVDGEVTVSLNTLVEERRAPIDIFFRTLAETHDSRAVCVVLSGTGADGSMGLKRVKERGGAVFVQNPREATFNEMPRNAIATDLVDDVLPVTAIPARIVAYKSRQGTIAIPMEAEERPQEQQQALREVLTQLRARTGHDFSNYKRPTLLRRIERRINIRELPDLPAYAAQLPENPGEVQGLLKDLLISVTNFFRDKEAFTVLEQEILPRIFQGKRAEAEVRIWVAGCASGEEAYSIAMLCAEHVLDTLDAPTVQIFATDIDEAAIAHAREGLYSATDTADVSPERLRRFFTTEDQRYRIRREIREMVLFANHNVLKDPPFSHLDLVSCRNLLIYLNHTAQERVMETLHFALNPGGYLFLGTSESVDGATDLYTTISREQHIFQSRQAGTRPFPVPESVPTQRIDLPRRAPTVAEADAQARERIGDEAIHQRLLEEYAPPSAVVNADYDIVHLSERAGRYLQVSGGKVSNNLLKLIRPELHVELRSALYQALQRQTKVDTSTLPLRIDDHTELITIRVRPVLRHDDPARGLLLVIFEQGTGLPSDAEIVVRSEEGVTRQLEDEVQRLKQQLRTSSEQYEFQAEELKATNEEQQALNEELRSSNEELETSKEELQSLNEELRTVNQELKVKIEEATQTSANLQNLVNATNIGTIFLDRSLRIKLFTPSVRALFNLIPADYGRPLADITHRLVEIDVLKDAETVLDTLQPIEREVRATNDQVFVLRVLPYRVAEDRIGGVAITFFDITERKRAEAALSESEARFRLLIEGARDYAMFLLDSDNRITFWSTGAERVFGYTEAEVLGQSGGIIFTTEDRERGAVEHEVATTVAHGRAEDRRWHVRKDGTRLFLDGMLIRLDDEKGQVRAFVKIGRDTTLLYEAEDALQRAHDLLETRVAERTSELAAANDLLQQEIVERRQLAAQRAVLLERILTEQETERLRIARELHDTLGQFLSALSMRLSTAQSLEGMPSTVQEELAQLQTLSRHISHAVDHLTMELRPPALQDFGLPHALRSYAEEWSATSGIPADVLVTGLESTRLSEVIETTVYRIVQEALTNVLKHAQANAVSVLVERRPGALQVIIEDNGVGFEASERITHGTGGRQVGLIGMVERMTLVGGELTIESLPGSGTTIYLHIPIGEDPAEGKEAQHA